LFLCLLALGLDTVSESRYVQQVSLRVPVARTAYSPDGRSLIYTTTKDNLFWLEYCRKGDDVKEEWHNVPFDFTCPDVRSIKPSICRRSNPTFRFRTRQRPTNSNQRTLPQRPFGTMQEMDLSSRTKRSIHCASWNFRPWKHLAIQRPMSVGA